MKVFEVGLVCEIEGGSGVLIADSENLYTDIKFYLLGSIGSHLESIESLYDGTESDYERDLLKQIRTESQQAYERVGNAHNIAALRQIKMRESLREVMIREREVLGGGK